jgi:hypothetical protein
MRAISEICDPDIFFYYGSNPLELELDHDVMVGLLQPKRSMFYARSDGAGIPDYENKPSSFMLEIGMRYDIVNWIAYRNTVVGDGNDGTAERRVAACQFSIDVVRGETGEVDVSVEYIPYADYSAARKVNAPLTTGV